MDESTRLLKRIQVETCWGDTPLDVVQVDDRPGLVQAGSARSCDVPVPEDVLPSPDFPLLSVGAAEVWVRAGREDRLQHEEIPGHWVDAPRMPDPDAPGVYATQIPPGRRVRVKLGRLSLTVSRVEVQPVARRRLSENLEPVFINSLLVVLFFAAGFMATLLLGPRALGSTDSRMYKNPPAYVYRLVSNVRTPRVPVLETMVKEDLDAETADGLAPGKPGKAGKIGAPDVNKRRAVKGPKPDDRERLARKGFLAVMNTPGGPATFETTGHGLGGDLEDAIGNLTGKVPGESGGWGGLALKGTNTGGGCTNCLPSRTYRNKLRIPVWKLKRPRRKYTKPTEQEVVITRGEAIIDGPLPPEVIRRVVRRHRQQMKWCYERELTRHPDLTGRVTLHWLITMRGTVKFAEVSRSKGVSHSGLGVCIVNKVRTWLFPRPRGGEAEVYYPFLFAPSGHK